MVHDALCVVCYHVTSLHPTTFQLHAVGTVAPSPYTPNVAIVTPMIVGVHDRDTMAENMQHPLLRKAALASAVAAAVSATVNAWV